MALGASSVKTTTLSIRECNTHIAIKAVRAFLMLCDFETGSVSGKNPPKFFLIDDDFRKWEGMSFHPKKED
jgi:hypothetical protein